MHNTPSWRWWSTGHQTCWLHLLVVICLQWPEYLYPLVKIISYNHLKGFSHACLIMPTPRERLAPLGVNYQAKTIHATKSTKFLNSRKPQETKGKINWLITIMDKKKTNNYSNKFFRGYFYLFSWSWDTNLTSFNSVIQLAGEWLGMVI